jgi:YidC/Oxa1 family membrane protein insertase
MMALYAKEKVNPLGSCLPLIIQMPILIGLYWVIASLTDTANIYHTYSFLSFFDTAKDVDTRFFGMDLLSAGGIAGGILALLLGITQHIQARLSFVYQDRTKGDTVAPVKVLEKNEKGEYIPETPSLMPDPEMMKKVMLYMLPLFIASTGYFFPLGVGLYWLIGTLFVIVQQAWVNRE